MRPSPSRLTDLYAELEGRPAPVFGLVAAFSVTTPIVVGVLTGHASESVLVSLGAFFVAIGGPEGPYGARARSMLVAVGVVGVFTWFGGLLSGHPWAAVAVVPVVAALGAATPWIGPPAALCTILAAIRPTSSPVLLDGLLEMIGGLWITALLAAPWFTNRLRPLRAALAEAARSVAAALDTLPDPDQQEWIARRRSAYEAIRAAQATYGLYRAGGRDDQQRPKRLLEAFDRVMAEAVAMRSLLAALWRDDPPPEWAGEHRIAVDSLADRLRALADSIVAGGGAEATGGGTVSLERFVRVSEEVRGAWLAGRQGIVGTALILQIRRTVRRIAGTIEGATQIVARGLSIGFDSPRLPRQPPGAHGRLVEAVRSRSPGFRHATRVGAAIAVAMALATGLRLPHGQWLVITIIFSLRDSYGDTVERVVKRVGGATVGGMAAALALAIAPQKVTLILLIFVGGAFGYALRSVNHAYWQVFATPMIMMLIDFTQPLDWKAAAWRIGLTAGGGIIALTAARLLWPAGTMRRLPEQLARLMRAHADLARVVADRFGAEREAPVHRRWQEARTVAVDMNASIARLGQEPDPPGGVLRNLRDIASIAQRLRDSIATLGTLAMEEDPSDAGPIPAILDRVADYLEDGADMLLSGEDLDGRLDLGDLLDELDEHLGELGERRRAELAGGVGTDEVTTLRRSLVQVASGRHAVRTLTAEAEHLRQAIQDMP